MNYATFLPLAIMLVCALRGADAEVTMYPVPDPVSVCPYEVSIDGQPAPIQQAGAYQGAYYVRFEFSGKPRVQVRVRSTAATSMQLKPERFRTGVTGGGETLGFDVESPGPRVITTVAGSRELWPLIILGEASREPFALDARTVNLSKYLSGDGPQTTNIQKALDDCPDGGTAYFGPGIYLTGPVYVPSNTNVYLAAGCVIRGSDDPEHFRVEPRCGDFGSPAPGARTLGLINFCGVSHSRIYGPGVIDCAGHILRDEHDVKTRALVVSSCEDVRVEDVLLRNAGSWTLHILGSKNVNVRGVRIIADWAVGNTDGINPDCSQSVTITDYFGYCGDDAVAIKTTSRSPELEGSRGIVVRDCLVMTRKTAFKIGTETRKDISNVLFDNCEAISSSRGVGIYVRDGATISDVTYRNLRLDLMEYAGEGSSGMPFTVVIEKRDGVGAVRRVAFDRVRVSAPYFSVFRGYPGSRIEDVSFRDCELEIRNRSIKMDVLPVVELVRCSDVRFERLKLRWNTALRGLWTGPIEQEECERVRLDTVESDS